MKTFQRQPVYLHRSLCECGFDKGMLSAMQKSGMARAENFPGGASELPDTPSSSGGRLPTIFHLICPGSTTEPIERGAKRQHLLPPHRRGWQPQTNMPQHWLHQPSQEWCPLTTLKGHKATPFSLPVGTILLDGGPGIMASLHPYLSFPGPISKQSHWRPRIHVGIWWGTQALSPKSK